ncbi:hypothetical protein [Paludisphaera soli]|uniref:hypothetical protein n=1 Tax=Paludisphaera soli TaxID=2712865 RepID=UPI0013EC5CA7|nr:hypothetical protein [Paludisphaera soli]
MGWERRGDVFCYYHPRRVGGRVVKGYHGSGAPAQLAADLIAEVRDLRADRVRARAAARARLDDLDRATAELDAICDMTSEAARAAGGGAMHGSDAEGPQGAPNAEIDEIRGLLTDARRGGDEALARLRAALDRRPEIWRRLGDLAAHVERSWIGELAGPDAALAEIFARKAADLRRELGGAAASPLERLLVDRVVACWLQVHHADLAAARPGGATAEGRDRLTRRQSAAERRYVGAIEALARLRRTPSAAGEPRTEPTAEPGGSADVIPFEPPAAAKASSGAPGSVGDGRGRRRAWRS